MKNKRKKVGKKRKKRGKERIEEEKRGKQKRMCEGFAR